ncbi:hypothetical protein HaLaN_07159 [Haematococcus lacustris]|uniref:Uncharacterized protein n=1 Tax=Haematococcus lacustris TaxID=44745 RepID=A0A699YVJ8_HAELA|nr:hypothetical protein HaLaN_07159 [Haematococcus lacustris]
MVAASAGTARFLGLYKGVGLGWPAVLPQPQGGEQNVMLKYMLLAKFPVFVLIIALKEWLQGEPASWLPLLPWVVPGLVLLSAYCYLPASSSLRGQMLGEPTWICILIRFRHVLLPRCLYALATVGVGGTQGAEAPPAAPSAAHPPSPSPPCIVLHH